MVKRAGIVLGPRTFSVPRITPNHESNGVTSNAKNSSESGVLASGWLRIIVEIAHEVSFFLVELHALLSVILTQKSFCYLRQSIKSVLAWSSGFKMGGVAARWIVLSGAFVKNILSFWNWPYAKNMTSDMSRNDSRWPVFEIPPVDLSIAMMPATHKRPASVWTSRLINLRPKALWKRVIESLRQQVFFRNFDHNSVQVKGAVASVGVVIENSAQIAPVPRRVIPIGDDSCDMVRPVDTHPVECSENSELEPKLDRTYFSHIRSYFARSGYWPDGHFHSRSLSLTMQSL